MHSHRRASSSTETIQLSSVVKCRPDSYRDGATFSFKEKVAYEKRIALIFLLLFLSRKKVSNEGIKDMKN